MPTYLGRAESSARAPRTLAGGPEPMGRSDRSYALYARRQSDASGYPCGMAASKKR